jgi:PTS system IIC component
VIFGAPIVLNPILMIPFMLAPMAAVTINYIAFATNIVAKPLLQLPFTVPVFLSGFISSSGDWKAIVLQLVNIVVAGIIYYPFFKMYEKQLINSEQEGVVANE